MEDKLFYSVQTAANMLDVHENTIKRLIYDKKITAYKVGKLWRIPKEDLINYVTSQETNHDMELKDF